MLFIFSIIFFILCIGLILLVGRSSIDNKWKINIFRVNCPNCGNQMPIIRNPTSTQQALWGGWSCSSCGCEMDKWGKKINAGKIEPVQTQIESAQPELIKPFDEKGRTPVEKVFEQNSQ